MTHSMGPVDHQVCACMQAIDVVQCRMKPAYMEPGSVVKQEFKEFCAQTSMDIVSVECIPEACALVKGQRRERSLPAGTILPGQQ